MRVPEVALKEGVRLGAALDLLGALGALPILPALPSAETGGPLAVLPPAAATVVEFLLALILLLLLMEGFRSKVVSGILS